MPMKSQATLENYQLYLVPFIGFWCYVYYIYKAPSASFENSTCLVLVTYTFKVADRVAQFAHIHSC